MWRNYITHDLSPTNDVFEYWQNAEALAEKTGGEVVRVFYTKKTHVWAADLDECEFEGYGVLVRDDWGDEKLL